MSGSFILALGLAAIDGLTSAFVAMLVLALVVTGGDGGAAGPGIGKSVVVTIVKRAPVKLMVRVGAGEGEAVPVYALDQNTFQTIKLSARARVGRVMWRDCRISSSGSCVAQMLIEQPLDHQKWRMELAIATTDTELSNALPKPVTLDVRVDGAGTAEKLALCWDSLAAAWQQIEFTTAEKGVKGASCKT